MLKNSRIISTLACAALVLCMAADGFALQTKTRKSQGNNYGLELNLGSTVFSGTSEYPRGSGNAIPTYEGGWGHFLAVARDLDGDGYAEDTLDGASRGRTIYGQRGSLEAMDIVQQGVAAGYRLDQWMSRVENNEVWSSLDPDNLARWPAEFRYGRTMSGAPIVFGAETIGAMHSDAWNISYQGSVPPTGVSMEYEFYFLNFGESNDLAFGHMFLRNMSEYLKYNNNSNFVDLVANTPDGQVWDSFALMYVENYFGIGFSTTSMDEGWAYHPKRVIKCMVDQNGLESGFTNGGIAFAIGYTPLKNMEFNGETTFLSNTTNFRWGADFGISNCYDIGSLSNPGQVFRWATCLQPDGTQRDLTDMYGDELSPYTGRALTGNPGVILPTDQRYDQWLWGRQGRINYHAWSGLHQFGPRDTTTMDFAIMAAYPANPPLVMKPNDIANIDDPDMQVQLAPFEHMQDVAQSVYGGGYVLPETPVPPPLTIVPGDRQVTITWSNVNLNTPDAYYAFIQENPEVDPDHVYRQYDFEGYRLYRNFVGPSEAHSEKIWEGSLADGNLAFYYVDTKDLDEPYHRMSNGMKVWYALVPYDKNYDPATGEEFSLPDPAQSKTWNRTFPAGYYTVRPRSDASNFKEAEVNGEITYVGDATEQGLMVDLAGDGSGKLTEAPHYLVPPLDFSFEAINNERISQDITDYVSCTGVDVQWACPWWAMPMRILSLTDASGGIISSAPPFATMSGETEMILMDKPTADGVSYAIHVFWTHPSSSASKDYADLYLDFDTGSYAGAEVNRLDYGNCSNTRWGSNPSMGAYIRSAKYELTWKASGGGLSLDVVDLTHGTAAPFSPYRDELGAWGFMPDGTYSDFFNDVKQEKPRSDRTLLMEETVAADNTDNFAISLNGIVWEFSGITAMPAAGDKFTIVYAFGDWNDDQTVFTQIADAPWPGDSWKVNIKGFSLNSEDIDLSKIRVVPNPYIATSMLDQSPGSRRIDFVNLPDRCTIRIYSLGGNLVNVLNHIGASRTGWGNFTDYDNIQPDNTPLEFAGSDNHSGTEPWNMKNRFGQTVASGLYFYHVTDERGKTHIGKFYIVN